MNVNVAVLKDSALVSVPCCCCRDLALAVAALSFNQWFMKFSCRDHRLVRPWFRFQTG